MLVNKNIFFDDTVASFVQKGSKFSRAWYYMLSVISLVSAPKLYNESHGLNLIVY